MLIKTEHFRVTAVTPFDAIYPLTVNDSIVPPVNNAMAFIYKTSEKDQINLVENQVSLVERMHSALESLLREPQEGVHGYPELLGELREDPKTRMVSIYVTKDSSVPFTVSYRHDIAYQDLRPDLGFPPKFLKKSIFAPRFTGPAFPDSTGAYEGFWVQLTFINGGFVIVTSRHHWLADGNALAAFIQLWFQRARNAERSDQEADFIPSNIAREIHDRSLLHEEKLVETLPHPEYKVKPGSGRTLMPGVPLLSRWLFVLIQALLTVLRFVPFIPVPHPETQIFHFTSDTLGQLKSQAQSIGDTKVNLSVSDALMAFLWLHITKARHAANPKLRGASKLATTINMRSRLEPSLPAAWFGNALYTAIPSMEIDRLISSASLAEIAQYVKESLTERATDRHFRSSTQFIKGLDNIMDSQLDLNVFMGQDLFGSNWMWFFASMESLELGLGSFQRMRWPESDSFDGLFIVLPAYGVRDKSNARYPGGLEVRIELDGKTMKALKSDDEFKKLASCIEC
ncbi:hypothetical protein BX600DRAFT_466948 [Xylariales sp. PMI_506]|nr:hypothetical protein BX600DRAFT_466948 [Xylariales sp. PMI_506]